MLLESLSEILSLKQRLYVLLEPLSGLLMSKQRMYVLCWQLSRHVHPVRLASLSTSRAQGLTRPPPKRSLIPTIVGDDKVLET